MEDVEIFFTGTRRSVTNLITKDLKDLDSAKVQTTAWIRFKAEAEDGDGDGNIVRDNTVDKAFISQMMEVFKGSNLNEIIKEMFAHMKAQVEQPICVRLSPVSRCQFSSVESKSRQFLSSSPRLDCKQESCNQPME